MLPKLQMERYAGYAIGLTRIVVALLFLEHGTGKFFVFPHLPSTPAPFSMFWIAGLFELIGGGLLVVGLFSSPVAFVLSGEMAVGYFIIHAPRSFFPIVNGGEAAILFCFLLLLVAMLGPGSISLDAWLDSRQRSAHP